MGMYIQHKTIEGAGWAEGEQPMYNRRLWDDRCSWMKAPNLRSVIDIAMTIALSSVTGGVGGMLLNAALNMIDDAVFTMMDMANGMDPMAALEGLGKKALVSLASSSISGVANGFNAANGAVNGVAAGTATTTSKTIVNSGLKGVLGLQNSVVGSTLLKGTELMATNITSSAINSVSLKGLLTGGDAFDENAFKQGAFGKNAMTSVFAGMTGTAVTTGMGNWKLRTQSGNTFTGVSESVNINTIKAFNGTMGSLASTAVTYGLTGNAKVNVLNASMFGSYGENGVLRTGGMFELNFGKDGFSGGIGMGGTDVSAGAMYQAMLGLGQTGRITQMKLGGEASNTALETIAMIDHTGLIGGSDEHYRLARELFARSKRIELTDGVGANKQEYLGMVNPNDSSVININRAMLGDKSLESYAKIAAVMSHEGNHQYGEHVESAAYAFGGNAYLQMVNNLGLQGDETFLKGIVAGMANKDNGEANVEGGEEYWKAMLNGDGTYSFQWDGDNNFDLSGINKKLGFGGMVTYKDMLADPKKFAELLSGMNLGKTGSAVTAEQLKAMATVSDDKVKLQDHLDAYEANTIANKGKEDKDKVSFGYDKSLLETFQSSLLALQNMGCITGLGTSLVNDSLQKGSLDGKHFYSPTMQTTISTLFEKRLNIWGLEDINNPLGTLRDQIHNGVDVAGAEKYYASSGGTMTLQHSKELGVYSEIKNQDTKIEQKNAHNGSGTIDNYMSLWGRSASGLSQASGVYSLTGVEAGSQVGTYADIGLTDGQHLHGEYIKDGKLVDPMKLFSDAGISMTITASAKAYSGYRKDIDPSSAEFVSKLFGQPYSALKTELAMDIIHVLDTNNIWNSEGFNSLPTDTVTSYFKNWWSNANMLQKQNMYDYANRKQIEGYMAWKRLPYDVQQQHPYQF